MIKKTKDEGDQAYELKDRMAFHTIDDNDNDNDNENDRIDVVDSSDSEFDSDSDTDSEELKSESGIVEKTIEYPEGGKIAYITLFGSFIGLVAEFGLWNSLGAIESYVSANILPKSNPVGVSMIFALFSFNCMFGSMVSGVFFDKFGAKFICWLGSVLVVGGLMATANCKELYQFILAFGFCAGWGCALLTSPLVTCIGHFFFKKRGMALAISMPGASLGGVIWPQVCRVLYGKVGFPWTMRILGFCFAGLLVISCICVHDRHEEILRIKKENESQFVSDVNVEGKVKLRRAIWNQFSDVVDFSCVKDKTFMVLTGALFLNEFSLIMTTTYIPSYALSKGYGEGMALSALTIFNAAGVLGRIIPAYLSDRYGNFNLMCLLSIVMVLSIFILWLPLGQYLGSFLTFTIIYGFCVAGTLALTPLCTSAISKPKDFGKRYGTAYFFVSFCNLISLPIGMALTKTAGGFDALAAFAGATCFCSTICFLTTRWLVGRDENSLAKGRVRGVF
ncbi:hypothetical protein DAMA08_053080 [Martiniozyma asiatica (nom. inval.)]|nr:hypothetical protein DAMA08_053080 [Martiniozyma asiatica]